MARSRESQKIWVRLPNFSVSSPAASVNTAAVASLRGSSAVATAAGATQLGLPNEFTVVRIIGHYYVEHFAGTSAAGTTNNPAVFFGARVSSAEELEEMVADPNFASESGPSQDPMSDWMAWVPMYADNPSGFDGNASEITAGKGMFDLRAARRVDGLRGDLLLALQTLGTTPTGMIISARVSLSVLCIVH